VTKRAGDYRPVKAPFIIPINKTRPATAGAESQTKKRAFPTSRGKTPETTVMSQYRYRQIDEETGKHTADLVKRFNRHSDEMVKYREKKRQHEMGCNVAVVFKK
jgi:hypothetical protein